MDKEKPLDERTMELIRQVGDDIHPSIKLEIDYPSKHPDKKLPILDLKSLGRTKREENPRDYPDGIYNNLWVLG